MCGSRYERYVRFDETRTAKTALADFWTRIDTKFRTYLPPCSPVRTLHGRETRDVFRRNVTNMPTYTAVIRNYFKKFVSPVNPLFSAFLFQDLILSDSDGEKSITYLSFPRRGKSSLKEGMCGIITAITQRTPQVSVSNAAA